MTTDSLYGERLSNDTVRIERHLPGTVQDIWAWITDNDKRAQWMARGTLELRVGGAVRLEFRHAELTYADDPAPPKYADMADSAQLSGVVTACEPPRLLAHTWGDQGEVRYELNESRGGVRLVVTHQRLRGMDDMLSVSAGWHAHLDLLVTRVRGEARPRYWALHTRLEAEYARRLAG
ncbi:SRPBCC family protein [Hydrogenophaga sp. SNF1]|uniref:ATPase n=1 Tax=Hydrogenophaga borbori TaxID=2294117 RepID=A0A372EFH2_9BURK|nr:MULTISPECIES: SRPBCC family protein [Hydrogenophaga]RFP77104.1 ATPase [Hydrogenophaga borbori]WQB85086.1 SRPBCC family protein [Hydrogenophaga sp. SNF1]